MRSFTDQQGRTWDIQVHYAAVCRVRSEVRLGEEPLDLLKLLDDEGQLAFRLANDVAAIVDVVWCLCRPQAETRGVSLDEFLAGLAGETLDAASQAVLAECADFFPKHQRHALRKALGVLEKVHEAYMARVDREAESPHLLAQLAELAHGPSGSSGNAPGSSASNPGPSPSGNST